MKTMGKSSQNSADKAREEAAKALVVAFQNRLRDPRELKQSRVEQRIFINKLLGPKAYHEAVKIRGHAFIRGVEIILRNHAIAQAFKKNKVEKLEEDLPSKTKKTLKKNSIKSNKKNKQDKNINQKLEQSLARLATIQQNWVTLTHYDKNSLKVLVQLLSEELQENVFDYKKALKQILSKDLSNAENHNNWKTRDAIETIIQVDDRRHLFQVRIDEPITSFTKEQERQWLKILEVDKDKQPRWFSKLSLWEQNFLRSRIDEWKDSCSTAIENKERIPNLGDYLGVPPTTVRGYPGARNCYKSYFYTFKANQLGTLELVGSLFKIRSGHVSAGKVKDNKERLDIVKENIKQLILAGVQEQIDAGKQNILVDLQTLISPPFDYTMDNDRLDAVEKLRTELQGEHFSSFLKENGIQLRSNQPPRLTLITSNYPVNKYRTLTHFFAVITSFFSGNRRNRENSNAIATLKNFSTQYLQENPSEKVAKEIAMAKAALKQIDEISGVFQRISNFFAFGVNHNAERAALEQIAVAGLGGIRIGSCMSGKDREGAVSEHVAAMIAFYGKYGFFPPIPSLNHPLNAEQKILRDEYETMVAKEFLAGHEQAIAAANAEGATGLKSAEDILGKNIIAKVKYLLVNDYFKNEPYKTRKHWETLDASKLSHKIASLNKPSSPTFMWGQKMSLYEKLKPLKDPAPTLSSMIKSETFVKNSSDKNSFTTFKSESRRSRKIPKK